MSERIIIAGEPVEVPAETVTEGRAAVQAWHKEQLAAAGIAFTVAENGDPILSVAAATGATAQPAEPSPVANEE